MAGIIDSLPPFKEYARIKIMDVVMSLAASEVGLKGE